MTTRTGALLRALRSPRTTLFLLLALGVSAAAGTPLPPEELRVFYQERIGGSLLPAARFLGLFDTYRSPLFVVLVSLLALQVIYCTIHRHGRRRITAGEPPAVRVRMRRLLDIVLHLSVIVILAGSVAGSRWGFVGTRYLFLDRPEETVEQWPDGKEVSLGFSLVFREVRKLYYPLRLRVRVSWFDPDEKVSIVEVVEGRTLTVKGRGLELRLLSADVDTGAVLMEAVAKEGLERLELNLSGGEEGEAAFEGYRLKLKAFRHVMREVRTRIEVVAGGRTVEEGWLTPRRKVNYRGYSIYQLSMGADLYGFDYIGVQVSKDPGAPLFWAGAILMSVAVPFLLLVRHSRP